MRRIRRNFPMIKSIHTPQVFDEPPIIRLWMLRIYVKLGLAERYVLKDSFEDEAFAFYFGLEEWINRETRVEFGVDKKGKNVSALGAEFDGNAILEKLNDSYRTAEEEVDNFELPPTLNENIKSLSSIVGLSKTERLVLGFAILVQTHDDLRSSVDIFGSVGDRRFIEILSTVLGLTTKQLRSVFRRDGTLLAAGFLSLRNRQSGDISDKFEFIHRDFDDFMTDGIHNPRELMRGMILESEPTDLDYSDYPHLREQLTILDAYLKKAISEQMRGVNVLFYGPPGTGKTELARAVCDTQGRQMYCIADEDTDGQPLEGKARFKAYMAGQAIFANTETLFLFDEVEDVFSFHGLFTEKSTKAWVNRLLESNQLPTIWVSNSIRDIDPAHARRFDMVINVDIPGRKHREAVVKRYCGSLLENEAAARIAEHERVSPALVSRSARVASMAKSQNDDIDVSRAVETVLNSTLESQSHPRIPKASGSKLRGPYDLKATNADTDLSSIVEGLCTHGTGRLCLYGPPGTGKTAFGAWIAQSLDKRHIVKRGSDLISMWVGGTEKAIAAAFEEAAEEEAVLQFDEIDSFLQDRRRARASWEVTEVNEMLTQLEAFDGIFIASTNLLDGLDHASLRRFDQKVCFDYLRPDQAQLLFDRYCDELSLTAALELGRHEVSTLRNLTPGDFAAVFRSNRFNPIRSPADFAARLKGECGLKEDQQRPIGFIQ